MKIRARIIERFQSFKYRHAYMDDFTDAYIATQIKVLREQQNLTQVQLAEKAGMKQSQISELEDVDHRGWKVRTLKKLAKALDLALVVRFESFGRVLPDIGHLDRDRLQRTEFKNDPEFAPATASSGNEPPTVRVAWPQTGAIVLNASARFPKNQFDVRVGNVA